MPFYIHIRVNTNFRRLCSVLTPSKIEHFKYSSKSRTTGKTTGIPKAVQKFFERDFELLGILPHIPIKYLRVNSAAEHHYLISPKIAKQVVDKIMPFLDLSGKQLIAETNAGLGLISGELLERGVDLVRMYESCSEFRTELKVSVYIDFVMWKCHIFVFKDFGNVYPKRVELFTKDIFHLTRYAYFDRLDKQRRVENLFKNVKKRSWNDGKLIC